MKINGPLILGGTGRVGRAMACVWNPNQPVLWQYRPGAIAPAEPNLCWDILNTPCSDLPAGITGIVQLARGTNQSAEIALAQTACDLGARLGVPVLIASSQAVYSPTSEPVLETSPCQADGAYGKIKRAMEQAVAGRATCLRIGNIAGCDMLLMNAALGRITLDRLPDGTSPRRSWISPIVLHRVICGLITHDGPLPDVINVAQPGTVAMANLLIAAGLDWDWRDADVGVLPALELDVTRLMQMIPLPNVDAANLIADARQSGWRPAS